MPTLRRILKYTPSVVLGLLVVVCLVGQLVSVGAQLPWTNGAGRPGVVYCKTGRGSIEIGWSALARGVGVNLVLRVGHVGKLRVAQTELFSFVTLPLPLLVLLMLPFGVRHFVSLRVRWWHYLAYVSLVVVELAYYLWWNE